MSEKNNKNASVLEATETLTSDNRPELTEIEFLKKEIEENREFLKDMPAKQINGLFSMEHQGMIAAKYAAKYSDNDQKAHIEAWPHFLGNHFMLYVLAETLNEARKAVFSANRTILINQLTAAMRDYTPAVPGAILTELQTWSNKNTDMNLEMLKTQMLEESQRVEVLKAFSKNLKQASKTGKDTDKARLKVTYAADSFGVIPGLVW
jgi:hypothetical protein